MSNVSQSPSETTWKPSDKWLIGIVMSVITFWLFAQTLLNIIPGIRMELGLPETLANLSVSITSLFSGIFIVIAGDLADRVGRYRILLIGIWLSILGSLLIALTPEGQGAITSVMMLLGRIVQGFSAAFIMPSSMALVKTFYEGKDCQRALSFWSIGSWGGSGACSLFGGLVASSFLGWRSIFWISILVCVISLVLLRGTPNVKAEPDPATAGQRFDWAGVATFMIAIVSLNVYISQGPAIGWLSPTGLALLGLTLIGGIAFFSVETRKRAPFINLSLFKNRIFSGATLSNFLLNGAAGTLIVVLGLVQAAGGLNSLQSGLLTLGYLVAVLLTIRVGEKLLQRFGPKRPMIWGAAITGLGILLCSATFLYVETYLVLSFIGFTLFGIGLGFYATPSMDSALNNVPKAQVGAASGIYKMASSLGSATGVTVSAALYVAGQSMDPDILQSWGIFIGRQDNVSLRFGGAIGLAFNIFIVLTALISIWVTLPSEKKRKKEEAMLDVAPPGIGN